MTPLGNARFYRFKRSLTFRRTRTCLALIASMFAVVGFAAVPTAGASGATSVSNVAVAETGPTDAAGALSEFTFSFKTSSTGGMSQADSGEWYAQFPAGTGVSSSGQVTDITTNQAVGGVGACSSSELCGTFNGGVTINPGDTLSVDATSQTLPPKGSGYTISVHTSSDTTPTTSSNTFATVAAQAVSNVAVAETGPTDAAGALSEFTFSFKTSSTGGMSQADSGEWYAQFPAGTGVSSSGQVTDITTNQAVGGVGACSSSELCGTFNGGVTINPGDTLSVDATSQTLPPKGSGYTISVHTSSDTTPTTSSNTFATVAAQAVSNVAVAETGPTDAAGALSEFTFSFKTSSTGGMSQADSGEWYAQFPAGTGVSSSGQVTDITTNQAVGGVGACSSSELCGTFNGGVTINPGDTLSVDATSQTLPPKGSGYTISVHTSSDTTPTTSSNTFATVAAQAVSNVAVAETGPTDAAGALSEFTFSFKTSSTGGMSQADSGEWYAQFPAGTGVSSSGQVTDITTNQAVGGVGACSSSELCGTFNGGVTINPGDTLSVDATSQTLPPKGSGYTISVHTSSDTTPTTSSNTFKTLVSLAVSTPKVALSSDDSGTAGVTYSVSFKSSSTGAMWQSDSGEWYIALPAGSEVGSSGQVTDTTTGAEVGGVGTCGSSTLCGTFDGGVKITAGDTLQVVATNVTNTSITGSQTLTVTTSSDTVAASGTFAIEQSASISGTVTDANSDPVDGAPVQACPTDDGPCQRGQSGPGGTYALPGEGTGTYTLIAYPPANGSGSQSGPVSVATTVPQSVSGVDLQLVATVVMPAGTSLTSGGTTTQQGSVPAVNWGNPITYNVTGCAGGYGEADVTAVNTSTGQTQTNNYPLTETPAGSGTYVAAIPPLAPLHGSMSMQYTIACPGKASMLPGSGSPSGGTQVFIGGSGFSGATKVTFGGVAAASFTVLNDDYIMAASPAGTGTVPVEVTVGGTITNVGQFAYVGVTGISPNNGLANGGASTVTITGSNFNDVQGVMFGLLPAPSFTVVSPTEIQVTPPACLGTVAIEVTDSFGTTDSSSASQYKCTNGPPESDSLVEPTGPDALLVYANEVEAYASGGEADGWGGGSTTECSPIDLNGMKNAADTLLGDSDPVGFLEGALASGGGAVAALAIGADPVAAVGLLPVFVVGWEIWQYEHKNHKGNNGGNCGYIDPSGTVVNTSGSPVSGASVAILEQAESPTGPFASVDPSSGDIEPATNPETTGPSGTFDWDALAGTYEAQASVSGCYEPGHLSQPDVTTPPFTLPPPAVGLTLNLDCPGSAPSTPTVTGLSQSDGISGGGEVVEIVGSGLTGATAVHFGNAAASGVTVLSSDAVAAITPVGVSTVNVTVTTPGGTSATSTADRYTYVTPTSDSGAPSITKVTPHLGPTSGGTQVTLTGKKLSEVSEILIGGQAATSVTEVSATEIEATVPADVVTGAVSVVAIGSSGESSVSSKDSFKYKDFSQAPTVTKVSPASGSLSGGNEVTISGTDLVGATEVEFGTNAATSFKVTKGGTKIKVEAPAGSTGTVDITVTRPGGTSAVVTADRYTYT